MLAAGLKCTISSAAVSRALAVRKHSAEWFPRCACRRPEALKVAPNRFNVCWECDQASCGLDRPHNIPAGVTRL